MHLISCLCAYTLNPQVALIDEGEIPSRAELEAVVRWACPTAAESAVLGTWQRKEARRLHSPPMLTRSLTHSA